MGKGFASYLAMKTGPEAGDTSAAAQALIDADLREFGVTARKLANHAFVLGGGLSFGTSFLKWLAFVAAVIESKLVPLGVGVAILCKSHYLRICRWT